MKKDYVIGILGGMGTYATIHLFQQYAEVFPAIKEWERPRIIIDNRCTMPSRVRAFLYKENVDQLVDEMLDSMQNLVNAGCNKIILACNTSHLFLPKIYEKVPGLEACVKHIIQECVNQVFEDDLSEVYLLGSEGTIDSQVYQKALLERNPLIKCIAPKPGEYAKLRSCIEAVKQHQYSASVKEVFLELVNRYEACILGCTELPILYERYKDEVRCGRIYDPVLLSLKALKKEYDDE